MNIAAYCRVSTDKADQLNSLETQKKFFVEYTERTGDTLVCLYADEGISGTKIKNRKQFQKMMADAERGMFDRLVVKDISRFARNTVDLLQNIRRLRELGIETNFLTANMTSLGNSEFLLTVFGAIAQEESCNTSKRVKFGKKVNAEKGRVPNIVFGYDKTKGDYFNLRINNDEAKVVRQIFSWYINEAHGASKIADILNSKGIKTKRGCKWSQNAVCRILTNEIYIGKIINGKEEVADFLTGKRAVKPQEDWLTVDKPELRLIDDETFYTAAELMRERGKKFKVETPRHSNLHLFSTLIKCKDCGWSFRRSVRTYKNTYVRWVCSGHNRGADSCPNAVSVDENELIEVLQNYFCEIIGNKKNVMNYVVEEFNKNYKAKNENVTRERELKIQLEKLKRNRKKYMDMYTDDLISREELNEIIGKGKQEIDRIEGELKLIAKHITKGDLLKELLADTFREIEDLCDMSNVSNGMLRKVIDRIEVDHNGNVEIFLKVLKELGLDKTVRVHDTQTYRYYSQASSHKPFVVL